MPTMNTPELLAVHEPLLVNFLGHLFGAVVFGTFILLLVGSRRSRKLSGSRLSLAAAGLAFSWNVTSLLILSSVTRHSGPSALLISFSTCLLSFPPAVLLHLWTGSSSKWLPAAGYGVSAAATLLHLSEYFWLPARQHELALLLTTFGFGVLTLVAAAGNVASGQQGKRTSSRLVGAMALFLFAVWFLHLSSSHPYGLWAIEMVFHHAGIPLALFVLLQDYRFVLVDAFVRFLGNFLLAAGFTYVTVRVGSALSILHLSEISPSLQALLFVAFCLALVLFAMARSTLQRGLTRLAFPRKSLNSALARVRHLGMAMRSERDFLSQCAGVAADYMDCELYGVLESAGSSVPANVERGPLFPVFTTPSGESAPTESEYEVLVPLRLRSEEVRLIGLGRRRGGRRFVSEDLDALASLSSAMAEQLEAAREREMRDLVAQAELRALQAQIHPHFLFNALNALYGIIPRTVPDARQTVLNLAEIFRYFLETERSFISLEEEMRIVEAYLEIEALRLGSKLRTELDVPAEVRSARIPVLTVQPLVENAVSHGVAPVASGGTVTVRAARRDDCVVVSVHDTGRGFKPGSKRAGSGHGVGLENVRRRLQLCYGDQAQLTIESSEMGTTAAFTIPANALQEAAL